MSTQKSSGNTRLWLVFPQHFSFSQTSTRVSITRGLVEENHATVKSDSRIKLPNLEILEKLLGKSSKFLSSEQPCEPKSLDVALKIAGVEKIPSENLWLRPTKGAEMAVKTFDFCGW